MNVFLDRILSRFKHYKIARRAVLLSFDVFCFVLVTLFYYLVCLRASSAMPVRDNPGVFLVNALLQLVLVTVFRLASSSYRNVWRYTNTSAYLKLVIADAVAGIAALLLIRLVNNFYYGLYFGIWEAVTIGALNALIALSSRFCYAILYKHISAPKHYTETVPVAIVGAGRLGNYLAGDFTSNPNSKYDPLFFIDKDAVKVGNRVHGMEIYDPESAENLIKKLNIQDIIITITNKTGEELSELYNYYRGLGCRVQVCSSVTGSEKAVLREVSIEDLLFRKQINVSDSEAQNFYRGKTVLITGGGGSIGSEICRQAAACGVGKLIIFDIYENNAYDIQQELIRKYGNSLDIHVEIGSVRDAEKLDRLFAGYRPQIVFHAAAHKHVPLMENCPEEAIKNNCIGTYQTADAAEKYGAEKFILISTDKAVNPTSVMGASKRICEMIIQSRSDSTTTFAAVRFGNVLGSNGSVIPLFRRQIQEGGPVTITDKRIIRYFMTIPEASQLVLQAGAMAKKGELFVLDMGKPVRIYDLAVNMIRLSNLEPGKDIEIKEIGLRPGEKLYEELLIKSENLSRTDNNLIFVEHDRQFSRKEIDRMLDTLRNAVEQHRDIRQAVAAVVPTYHDAAVVNKTAEQAEEMQQVVKG